jgi:hypothetical protein
MCLKMLVFYFYGMRKFLMEVTGVDDVSPSDFERVCRSVEGLDEFGLLTNRNSRVPCWRFSRIRFPTA